MDHGRFSVGNKWYRTSFVGNAAHLFQNGKYNRRRHFMWIGLQRGDFTGDEMWHTSMLRMVRGDEKCSVGRVTRTTHIKDQAETIREEYQHRTPPQIGPLYIVPTTYCTSTTLCALHTHLKLCKKRWSCVPHRTRSNRG